MSVTETTREHAGRYDWFLLVLLAVSLASNLILGIGLLRNGAPATSPRELDVLKTGSRVPPLQVETLEGKPTTIRFDDMKTPTWVYVFTPSCAWCEKNLANLHKIAEVAKTGQFRLIGISLDPNVRSYIESAQLDFPVFVKPSRSTWSAYHFGATPQTFIISSEAKVVTAFNGAYAGATKAEVESYLGAPLPGLETPPNASID